MAYQSTCTQFPQNSDSSDKNCSMKLDKDIVQRRVDLMAAEGVVRISAALT